MIVPGTAHGGPRVQEEQDLPRHRPQRPEEGGQESPPQWGQGENCENPAGGAAPSGRTGVIYETHVP